MAKIHLDKYYSLEELSKGVKIFEEESSYIYYLFPTGEVYNLSINKLLNINTEKRSGLKYVNIQTKKGKRAVYLHRILAKNFIENLNAHQYIHFKDGDSSNCNLDNLIWSKNNREIKNTKYVDIKYNAKSKFYQVWKNMVYRCTMPSNCNYEKYGAIGIKVCDEWLDYEVFYKWSLANNYKEGLTIDRINGELGYNPENCRWVNYTIQNINKKQKPSKSGYIGVNYDKRDDLWIASVSINNKTKAIAYHKTDIRYLVEARNNFIIENNLPNKLNKYFEALEVWKEQIPELQ